jgi:hypothetical protein
MRKTNKTKTQTKVVYLEEGTSIADVLKQAMADGVTDLSAIRYAHEYGNSCCGHADGEYCYCSQSYNDMRFEYEVEVK